MSEKLEQIVIGTKNVDAFKKGDFSVLYFDWKDTTLGKYDEGDTVEATDNASKGRKVISKVKIVSIKRIEESSQIEKMVRDDWGRCNFGKFTDGKLATKIKKLMSGRNDPVRIEIEPASVDLPNPNFQPYVSINSGTVVEIVETDGQFEIVGAGSNSEGNDAFQAVNMDTAEIIQIDLEKPLRIISEGTGSAISFGTAKEPENDQVPSASIDLSEEIESLKFKLKHSEKEAKDLRNSLSVANAQLAKKGLVFETEPFERMVAKQCSEEGLDGEAIGKHFIETMEVIINKMFDANARMWAKVRCSVAEKEDDSKYGDTHTVNYAMKVKLGFDSMRVVEIEGGKAELKVSFPFADGGKSEETYEGLIGVYKEDVKQYDLFDDGKKPEQPEEPQDETLAGEEPVKEEPKPDEPESSELEPEAKEPDPEVNEEPDPVEEDSKSQVQGEPENESESQVVDPYEEGRAHAASGGDINDNKYEEGTPEAEMWTDGFITES